MIVLRLRSFLFNVGWYVGTTILAIVGSPILLMPRRFVVAWSLVWIDFCLWWLRVTCRLTHRVSGLENMPTGPVIFACKHQSSWETLAFSRLFPGAATVMKRELVLIPIVGWAMARAGNIAVARGDGAKALRGLVKQAKATLEEGRSILIFPEGTRVAVGDEKPYQVGTAAPLPAARRARRPGRAELRPVLGAAEVHQTAGRDRRRNPAGDPAWSRSGRVHGHPARAHRECHGPARCCSPQARTKIERLVDIDGHPA